MNMFTFLTIFLHISIVQSSAKESERLLDYPKQVVAPDGLPSVYVCEGKTGEKTCVIPTARYLEGHFHGWQQVVKYPENFLANGHKEKEQLVHASRVEPFSTRGVAAGRTAAEARIRYLIRHGYKKETILRACRAAVLPPIEPQPIGELQSLHEQLEMKDGEIRFKRNR